ncbi:hypothetical protein A8B82_10880 [Sulfitobacter sp. EhC04]|uniref:hypothetical protein n=1 Tax=Sulfitobacter sp. EhC04 TaxID=1849168 RepID=UPI0007F326BD|nr:hypothetical protein [Sulfitobacter sp. EhC04]OAN78233.1 hypothetical protein A8B82_10880 [Sulfitobacter sp. EhC04]
MKQTASWRSFSFQVMLFWPCALSSSPFADLTRLEPGRVSRATPPRFIQFVDILNVCYIALNILCYFRSFDFSELSVSILIGPARQRGLQ